MTAPLVLLLLAACKDPETAAVQTRVETFATRMADGRTLMAANQPERAARAFRAAAAMSRENPEPLLMLAEAHRAAGNDGAAILALKEAESVAPGNDPAIQKQMADLYLHQGQVGEAIATLKGLLNSQELSNPEILSLARLQARSGDPEGAFKTLEPIQSQNPDDPKAKVVEAEILLIKGDELLAAKLMDRLIEEDPEFIEARLLRVRYFLNSGYTEVAEQDIASLTGKEAKRPEVVIMHARILGKLSKHEEAAELLTQFLEQNPENVDAAGQLAEVKLNLGKMSEAQDLVDKVLRVRSRYPQALYVRARILEAQGDKKGAEENYDYALSADPNFAPALSRRWRMQQDARQWQESRLTLEKLYKLGEASLEEKVALAELYADSKTNLERGQKIVNELLHLDPANAKYVALKAALTPAPKKKKSSGPIILRGGR
ncbi:MAG TPA: tetratricopeptide repeat protein [Hyalangium sp.]|nr:tetratricopeptide repeat protein [Hyalangium sp.]